MKFEATADYRTQPRQHKARQITGIDLMSWSTSLTAILPVPELLQRASILHEPKTYRLLGFPCPIWILYLCPFLHPTSRTMIPFANNPIGFSYSRFSFCILKHWILKHEGSLSCSRIVDHVSHLMFPSSESWSASCSSPGKSRQSLRTPSIWLQLHLGPSLSYWD